MRINNAPADWSGVRARRDQLLVACDWTQMPDAPLDAALKEAWRAYRQQLRDLTDTFSDPTAVVWPAQPTEASPAPPPVPTSISDRQFFQQLATVGIISQAEALAAVKTGAIPAALAGILDALPDDQKFAAEMLLSGATTFERAHPLSVAIGTARGMTAAEVDAFFRAAAAL
ncbi:tail fiber assembly protein [Azospirillum canadense]|uniref:tail fiber assembly protein n=1 Tax=Azospirillum canadense TaxID=403962 RepID=UPI002227E15F|nr:tail fiber assembly protein [Azospirillum canadense]MCW2242275.1 hypothetical protein [Azospirillum canadense]